MLIALVYVAVLVPQYRMRTSSNGQYLSSRRFWCARRVDPGYVTMNLHFLLPLGGFLSCACMLVYTCKSILLRLGWLDPRRTPTLRHRDRHGAQAMPLTVKGNRDSS